MIIHSHHIDRNRQKSDKSPFGTVPAVTYNSNYNLTFRMKYSEFSMLCIKQYFNYTGLTFI